MRAATGSVTPLETVLRWPWHRMLIVWTEAERMHGETWGMLLGAYYRKRDG